jgi:hypothetical protein
LKQLEYTWLRSLLQEYEDFRAVTRASLDSDPMFNLTIE